MMNTTAVKKEALRGIFDVDNLQGDFFRVTITEVFRRGGG